MQRNLPSETRPFHVSFCHLSLFLLFLLPLRSAGEDSGALFHLECPPDVTIGCDADLTNLSIYGTAYIHGYGNPQPAGPPQYVDYNLNDCNVGTIIRTWVAYDYAGTAYTCSQTITVGAGSGSVYISWPPDYVIHECHPQADPGSLPAPYDYPVISGGGDCSQFMTSYDDKIFVINPPACKKIVRTWTVIDWCVYNPNSYYPQGIWTYTQVIKIAPESPPVIWCPPDITISAGADCTGGHVSLPPATGASDCGAGVIITNNSPYAFSNGPDASGYYPLGTTKVTFWADDGCGKKVSCNMYVTVKDLKKPTPVCYYGISISMMQMPDGYGLELKPQFFNKGSFDNCTPQHKLKMWVEPSRVSCEDLGPTPVRLYVQDEAGNVDYCNTLVYVQDNMGMCPQMDGIVEGQIHTASGVRMEEVKVSVPGTQEYAMTDEAGKYALPALRYGKPYTIKPVAITDDLTGVSVVDLLALMKHILGIEKFQTPYQHVAADIDRNGRVSVNDMIALKDMILMDYHNVGIETEWRFIDGTYRFPDSANPIEAPFPEQYEIDVLSEDMSGVDFIAVKMGDINDDAARLLSSPDLISRRAPLEISVPDRQFEQGDLIQILLTLKGQNVLSAIQMALQIDQELVEVVAVELEGTGPFAQGSHRLEGDILSLLWFTATPDDQDFIVTLTLKSLGEGRIADIMRIADTKTPSQAVLKSSVELHPLQLDFINADLQADDIAKGIILVGQNFPNPFSGVTWLPVTLREHHELIIEIFDPSGRVLDVIRFDGDAGYHEIPIRMAEQGPAAVLFCRVKNQDESMTLRMVTLGGL